MRKKVPKATKKQLKRIEKVKVRGTGAAKGLLLAVL